MRLSWCCALLLQGGLWEPCAPVSSSHGGWVCRWGVGQNSTRVFPGWGLGVGSATLPHKRLHCYRNVKTYIPRDTTAWEVDRPSSTKANEAWQWKLSLPGSCQVDGHHLPQDHYCHRNVERTNSVGVWQDVYGTGGRRNEELQAFNPRNKLIAMDWLRSVETSDHRRAAAVFKAWTRKCPSHPGCGSDVVHGSSEGTNWMRGARATDHHSNLPHEGEKN